MTCSCAFGVTRSQSGISFVERRRIVEQRHAAGRGEHRVEHDVARLPLPQRVDDRAHLRGAAEHADLHRPEAARVAEHRLELPVQRVDVDEMHAVDARGVLDRDRRRHRPPRHADGVEDAQVGLHARAARGIEAGDRQRNGSHGLSSSGVLPLTMSSARSLPVIGATARACRLRGRRRPELEADVLLGRSDDDAAVARHEVGAGSVDRHVDRARLQRDELAAHRKRPRRAPRAFGDDGDVSVEDRHSCLSPRATDDRQECLSSTESEGAEAEHSRPVQRHAELLGEGRPHAQAGHAEVEQRPRRLRLGERGEHAGRGGRRGAGPRRVDDGDAGVREEVPGDGEPDRAAADDDGVHQPPAIICTILRSSSAPTMTAS